MSLYLDTLSWFWIKQQTAGRHVTLLGHVIPNLNQTTRLQVSECVIVCQWHATGWWFSLGTPVSSTNKTYRHHITEILLKVALNTIPPPKQPSLGKQGEWSKNCAINERFIFSCILILLHNLYILHVSVKQIVTTTSTFLITLKVNCF